MRESSVNADCLSWAESQGERAHKHRAEGEALSLVCEDPGREHRRDPYPDIKETGACQGCKEPLPDSHEPCCLVISKIVRRFCCVPCLVRWIKQDHLPSKNTCYVCEEANEDPS